VEFIDLSDEGARALTSLIALTYLDLSNSTIALREILKVVMEWPQ
jgi:hypothetical protein